MSEPTYRENRNCGVYFAIYPTHYVKLIKDVQRNEWTHMIRVAYNRDTVDIYHDVHWAESEQFTEGRPDRFWSLLNDAVIYLMKNYHKPLQTCDTLFKTSV